MDKLKMHTRTELQDNLDIIRELFPDAINEMADGMDENGNPIVKYAVNTEVLEQYLPAEIKTVEKGERFSFSWPGKKKAIISSSAPISSTLRPCRDLSINFDETENLYIEGDNLDALKLLQETYLNKVKMIYIDPPYNTGNDFIYNDDFVQDFSEYAGNNGEYDDLGNRLVPNPESNGRFHTDWLNMIYPRLKLARNLLSDDGVIFISIDDGEQANLKKVCDEIFGEDTLDRKSIDSAMDILINLSGANKLVGVISHREELIENIPQQIRVTKTKDGSHIDIDTGI